MPQLNHTIGDNKTFEIPLRWEGRNFTPGSEWNLMWTLYSDADDPEGSILRQKETDLGIVHSGNDALVTLVPQDTQGDAEEDPPIAAIAAGNYFWAVLAIKIADGTRRHVADGTYVLKAASTSLGTPSVPIYTSTPPSPNSVLGTFSSASAASSLTGTDETLIKRGTGLLRATYEQIKAYVLDSLTIAWGSVTGKPTTFPPIIGSGAVDAVAGNDSRLTDARTPTAHAASHAAAGGDPISILSSQVSDGTSNPNLSSAQKVVKYGENGVLAVMKNVSIRDVNPPNYAVKLQVEDSSLSQERTQSFQDKDGAIALTSDISDHVSATDPHGDRAYADAAILRPLLPARNEPSHGFWGNSGNRSFGAVPCYEAEIVNSATYDAFPSMTYDFARQRFLAVFYRGTGHITFDGDIYATESRDGKTWTTPRLLQAKTTGELRCANVTALKDGRIMLCYMHRVSDSERYLRYKFSPDGGLTYGTEYTFDTSAVTAVPQMEEGVYETRSGVLIRTFFRDNSGVDNIAYCLRSTDRGATWGSPILIASQSGESLNETTLHPLSNGSVRAFIRSNSNKVYYVDSADDGATWGAKVDVSPSGYRACRPDIMRFPSGLWMLQGRDATATQSGIWYSSRDEGATWSYPATISKFRNLYASCQAVNGLVFCFQSFEKSSTDADLSVLIWRDGPASLYGKDHNRNGQIPSPSSTKVILSPSSLTSGSVSSWTNDGTIAANADQGTAGNQPTVGAVSAGPARTKFVSFDGTDDYLELGTAADSKFCSDGTNFCVAMRFRHAANNATQGIVGTESATTTTQVGFVIYANDAAAVPANDRLSVIVANGNSGAPPYIISIDNVLPPNVWHALVVYQDSTTESLIVLLNDSMVGAVKKLYNHSASNPAVPLRIGALSGTATAATAIETLEIHTGTLTREQVSMISARMLV